MDNTLSSPKTEPLGSETLHTLKLTAVRVRMHILEQVYEAQSGHPGGSLSVADLLTYLYFFKMNVDPSNPSDPLRDRFVLSKGHCSPALYAVLAMRGFFPESELHGFRKLGRMLQGHPDMKHTPGIDMSTGSLGQGFSAAAGMAYVGKNEGKSYKVYAVCGDGEIQEGQIWEAAMFAGNYRLNNLRLFIDFNNLQISGKTTEIMNPCPIDEKFRAFGWNAVCVDGHDFTSIHKAVSDCEKSEKPVVFVMDTVKGKGVSFMENNVGWHGVAPKKDKFDIAMSELLSAYDELLKEEN